MVADTERRGPRWIESVVWKTCGAWDTRVSPSGVPYDGKLRRQPGLREGAQRAGLRARPCRQLVEMRIHGVSTKFVQELQALGYEHPPIEQLIDMHIHGAA